MTARPRLRHETSVFLEGLGYHLTTVEQPHEAETHLRRQRVEFVILDLPAQTAALPA